MRLIRNVDAIDLAIKIKSNLIITDIHIGHEQALNKQGFLIPRFQFPEIIKRLEKIFSLSGKKFGRIIINGDLKHEFGTISEQEWRDILRLLDFLSNYCNEIVIIKGNHDPVIKPIAEKRGIKIVENYEIMSGGDLILVTHGNHIPDDIKKYKTIIIGHEHPAVSVKQGPRVELYKCYLVGKFKRKNLIVQPSLSLITEGTDILKDKQLSPFLKANIDDFFVYAVEDRIYGLGKVRDVKNKL